ncbi:alpha/beta hydrolase family protein [Micromonospora zhanjiangensis]|uniref:Alpha/beta hydrolase family protein n=1 Tax=Micromonospora zhanjiangensis TaxID=1522057 RepID=A0ABV8KFN5_9ACTN
MTQRSTARRTRLLTAVTAVAAMIFGSAAPAAAAPSVPMAPYTPSAGLTATEVTFAGAGTTLHGSVVRRADLDMSVRHPGIVLVHGSGTGQRVTVGQEAEVFARAGIVTLIYDKRGDYGKLHRDFSAMARDALAGVHTLRGVPGVDPAKVGLWALSEGGWIAPMAAAESSEVAFLVTIGAPGRSPLRTQAWNISNRIAAAAVSPSTARSVPAAGMRIAAGTGLFPGGDHDPVPVLSQVRQPVLAMWGELDVQVPPRESAEIFAGHLTNSPSVTIRILPHGHHAGRVTTDGFDRVGGPQVGGFRFGELLPGYGKLMTDWIAQVTAGRPPASSADGLPAQRIDSRSIEPATWFDFAVFALLLTVLLSWPVTAVVRRLRGSRGAPVGAWPARALVVTGLAAALGVTGYVCWVVADQARSIGGTVLGQPVPWLLLRLLLVLALVSAVITGLTGWRRRTQLSVGHRLRLAAVTAGGLLLLPLALTAGLLQP